MITLQTREWVVAVAPDKLVAELARAVELYLVRVATKPFVGDVSGRSFKIQRVGLFGIVGAAMFPWATGEVVLVGSVSECEHVTRVRVRLRMSAMATALFLFGVASVVTSLRQPIMLAVTVVWVGVLLAFVLHSRSDSIARFEKLMAAIGRGAHEPTGEHGANAG